MSEHARIKQAQQEYNQAYDHMDALRTVSMISNRGRSANAFHVKAGLVQLEKSYQALIDLREELKLEASGNVFEEDYFKSARIWALQYLGLEDKKLENVASTDANRERVAEEGSAVVNASSMFSKNGRNEFNDVALNAEIYVGRLRQRIRKQDQTLSNQDLDGLLDQDSQLTKAFQNMVGASSLERQNKVFKSESQKFHQIKSDMGFGLAKLKEHLELN